MKKLLYFIVPLLVVTSTACKKHSNKPAVSMTAIMDGDTLWTTTNVATENHNDGTVYISAVNSATSENISLTLSGFIEGKKVYSIDYRGAGGNIYGNTGSYTKASNVYDGQTGNITVTSVVNNTITGSFNFYYAQTHMSGSFVAAKN